MRNLRNWTVLSLLLAATTSFATSTTVPKPQRDGGDPPPLCVPGDPTCKP